MKKLIVTAIASLFILTGVLVIIPGGVNAASTPINFSFPYQYGTPVVPSNVGAQRQANTMGAGLDGATVGPIGHVGANSLFASNFFIRHSATLTLTVYNGTVSSHTDAVGQTIDLYNATTWREFTAITSSTGGATFPSVWAGWWYIDIVSSSPSSHDGFTNDVYLSSGANTQTFYLPTNNWTIAVNNGGTGVISFTANGGQTGAPVVQGLLVNLWNGTGQTQLLGAATVPSNGTVHFTGVNPAYTTNIV